MEGYVKNISSDWAYAMKRSVKPGGEIPLTELFEQYGKKYDMKPDDDFIDWLYNVKLKNSNRWKIVYDFSNKKNKADFNTDREDPAGSSDKSHVSPIVSKKMGVDDVVNLSVRKAREVLPKINDLTLLKYSLAEANQLSDKDSLCKVLRKRIKELQIAR